MVITCRKYQSQVIHYNCILSYFGIYGSQKPSNLLIKLLSYLFRVKLETRVLLDLLAHLDKE